MEKRPKLWQNNAMIPNPYVQILPHADAPLDLAQSPSAAICGFDEEETLSHLQAQADMAGLALIRYANTRPDPQSDGFWTPDPGALKSLRRQNKGWQLVGVAQDRHSAMTLGEAGADLILFGHLAPLIIAGDLSLGMWWSELFEVPCGLILNDTAPADMTFGKPGWPEFFAQVS